MYTAIWLNPLHNEIVFEQRYRDYGAYMLRKRYEKIMAIAMLFGIGFFISLFLAALAFKKKTPPVEDMMMASPVILEHVESVPTPKTPKPATAVAVPISSQIQYVEPSVTRDDQAPNENRMPVIDSLKTANIGTITTKGAGDPGTQIIEDPNPGPPADIIKEPVDEKIYEGVVVHQKPEFPGGEQAMISYLRKNLKYSRVAADNGIEGTVFVRFVVTRTGSIDQVTIVKSSSGALNANSIEVIQNMPTWKPGMINGKAVSVYFMIPLKFELK